MGIKQESRELVNHKTVSQMMSQPPHFLTELLLSRILHFAALVIHGFIASICGLTFCYRSLEDLKGIGCSLFGRF
jgi:hypothetical protein